MLHFAPVVTNMIVEAVRIPIGSRSALCSTFIKWNPMVKLTQSMLLDYILITLFTSHFKRKEFSFHEEKNFKVYLLWIRILYCRFFLEFILRVKCA